jgi:ketoreductase RED2
VVAARPSRVPPREAGEGLVALVFGGSSGIGEAIAANLVRAGASVVVCSRSGSNSNRDDSIPHYRADVRSLDECQEAVAATLEQHGRLDLVFNTAGLSRIIPFDDLEAVDEAAWLECLETNVMGVWNVAKASAEALREGDGGSITNVTSVAGIRTAGSSIPYSTSKAAANHLTRLLARTLAPEIRVNAVAPGFVDTPLTASMPSEFRAGYENAAPLGRVSSASTVAEACVFLALSSFTTGEILVVDGGISLGEKEKRSDK